MKEKATLIESFVFPVAAFSSLILIGPLAMFLLGIVLALWSIVSLVKWSYKFINVAVFYRVIVLKAFGQKIIHTIYPKTIVTDKAYSKSGLYK